MERASAESPAIVLQGLLARGHGHFLKMEGGSPPQSGARYNT